MRIAAIQMKCAVGDVPANTGKIRDAASRAKQAGADWVLCPEISDVGYVMAEIKQHAQPREQGVIPELRALARDLSLGIICGVAERDGDAVYNTQVVINPTGELAATYRKTHLFQPPPIEEHTCFTAGDTMTAVNIGDMRAGLGICYDLRFPEFARYLACEAGAELLVFSSAWPFPRVEHLRTLIVARAIENQCYTILGNRVGTDNGVAFCGSSCIVDPYGVVVAAASADREEIVYADISVDTVRDVRQRMPVFAHRRPALYKPRPIP